MTNYLTDISANAPLMIAIVTALAALITESTNKSRPVPVYFISLTGLALAWLTAITNLNAEGLSFNGMLLHGGYANLFSALFCFISFFTVILSRIYFEKQNYHRGEFYIILLFAVVGMILIASANDLIIIFLGIEVMSVCLYVLAGFFRTKDRGNEAALKYFLLGAFMTGFLLYGIALIYGATGTTNLTAIKSAFPVVSSGYIFIIGTGFLIVGLAFKSTAVPFHMWAPDVYEGAPTPVSAFMSTAAKAAAFSAFITIFIRIFDFTGGRVNELIAILSAASMILGNIIAISQSNIKRMLAYSSIAHAGYMLAGIASGTIDGQTGVIYYLTAYVLMNFGAFAVVSVIETEDDQNLSLDDYAGLGNSSPLLAVLMAIYLFALAGVPPFAGFFGKYYVFLAAIKSKMTWLAVIGVLTSLVSAYYYLRVVVIMFFRDKRNNLIVMKSNALITVLIIFSILILLLGLFPSAVLENAQRYF